MVWPATGKAPAPSCPNDKNPGHWCQRCEGKTFAMSREDIDGLEAGKLLARRPVSREQPAEASQDILLFGGKALFDLWAVEKFPALFGCHSAHAP